MLSDVLAAMAKIVGPAVALKGAALLAWAVGAPHPVPAVVGTVVGLGLGVYLWGPALRNMFHA